LGNTGVDVAETTCEFGLRLIGDFEVTRAGTDPIELPSAAQRVVAFLAVNGGSLSRTYVAAKLWLGGSESSANASLRSALWRLRQCSGSGAGMVKTTRTHLRLDPSTRVDLHDQIAIARRLLGCDDEPRACDYNRLLDEDELLPGWYEDWVVLEREHVRQLRLHAIESVARRFLAQQRWGEAVDISLSAIRSDPLRESAHRTLIEAYLGEGNYCDALKAYLRHRSEVQRKLGIPPSPDLERLVKESLGVDLSAFI
jgi:DNA-binding SARP family transcriptional activator